MTTIDRDRLRTLAETSADDGYTGRDNYGRLTVSSAVLRPLLDELDHAEARIQAVRDICDRALAVKVQGSTDTDVAMAAAGATILRTLDAP